jgi:hypothetical protein
VRGPTPSPRRVSGDRALRPRSARLVRELWAPVLRRRRHHRGAKPTGGIAPALPRPVSHRGEDPPRSDLHRSSRSHDHRPRPDVGSRIGGAVQCARALARGGTDPAAAARHRSPGDLRGAQHPGQRADPGVDRRAEAGARGGRRGWLYRPGDGREPRSSRPRRDRAREAATADAAARRRDGRPGGRAPARPGRDPAPRRRARGLRGRR